MSRTRRRNRSPLATEDSGETLPPDSPPPSPLKRRPWLLLVAIVSYMLWLVLLSYVAWVG
jgi:hypothetical protein